MGSGEILRTDRLLLRQAGQEDVEAVHAIASDFDVVRNTGTWPWPSDREFTASRCQPIPADKGLGGVVMRDRTIVGMASVFGEGELGYMLARDHWGQGYATEICRALVARAFADGRWRRLKACVFDDNPGSARVLLKLGFAEGAACTSKCTARGADVPTRNFTLNAPQA
ncbi:GNAT family N-acetyltransferase [Roseovarius sp. CAU 1744]|uniref:GNAT family N-acetyltransferase n=1 Tax=Roseovarius sp. CAU 1744 TaxID=3140368 RepID=UPI00325BDE9B